MVIVNEKQALKNAIRDEEDEIIVNGKLAKRLSILENLKKNKNCDEINEDIGKFRVVATMSSLGMPVIVAITLIITVGVVSIVAILKNYSIKVKKGVGLDFEVTLDRGCKSCE